MTRIIAHRGASADRVENTRAAFDEALRQGADAIELDVQRSADGVTVVYHDRTLMRAGGGRRRVRNCEWKTIEALGRGADRVPRLEEVLEAYARKIELLIEIKVRGAVEDQCRLATEVAAELRRRRLESATGLLSFEPAVLEAAHGVAPRLTRVLNIKPPRAPGPRLRRVLENVDVVSADIRSLGPRFAEIVRELSRPLLVFTCNTERRVDRALDLRVDGIMSDRPGWLRSHIARREVA